MKQSISKNQVLSNMVVFDIVKRTLKKLNPKGIDPEDNQEIVSNSICKLYQEKS